MGRRARNVRNAIATFLLVLPVGSACSDDGGRIPTDLAPGDDGTGEPTVGAVHIVPIGETLIVGAAVQLSATVLDAAGNEIEGAVRWSTPDPDAVEVSGSGQVIVRRAGLPRVIAMSGMAADTIALECIPRLAVSDDSATVRPGSEVQLEAILVGAASPEPPPGAVTWSSSDDSIAEVSPDGMISGMSIGRVAVQAAYGDQVVSIGISVYRPQFVSISAGAMHSCGLLVEGTAWCWGANGHGDLGTGDTSHRLVPTRAATDVRFRQLEAAGGFTCAVAMDHVGYCWGDDSMMELGNPDVGRHSTVAVPLYGDLRLQMMSGSDMAHGCGLTLEGDAWCWGYNRFGMIGHGVARDEPRPVPAVGGHTFTNLHSFFFRTCGVDDQGRVYCWGRGGAAQVGDPSFEPEECSGQTCATRPHPVRSDTRFQAVSVGRLHTCALSSDGSVYCWGEGADGQIGTGTLDDVFTPAEVLPGVQFVAVTTGRNHSCALTVDGRALCWGDNKDGQLGDGSRTPRTLPTDVSTELRFVGISAGYMHTCAITAPGDAYCWGANGMGQLGDGTVVDHLVPAPVLMD